MSNSSNYFMKNIFDNKTEEQNITKMSDDKNDGKSITREDVAWFALKTAAISGAVLGGGALLLPAVGFTAGGVAAGSWAAGFQSAYLGGTIASGSTFALSQSVGAAGLAVGTKAAAVAGSALVAGAHSAAKKFRGNNETDSGHVSEESSASGSAFSLLKRAGGAGLAASSQMASITSGALVNGAHSALRKIWGNNEANNGHISEESSTSSSAFSLLKKAGAAGFAASSHATVIAGSAVVAGAHSAVKKIWGNN